MNAEQRLMELARLVRNLRNAQKGLARTRDNKLAAVCHDWARRADQAVEEILSPKTPGLFDGESSE